jgi:hypothetical protein
MKPADALTSFTENGFLIQEAIFTQILVAQVRNAVNDVLNGIYDTGLPPQYCVNVNCPHSVNRIGQIHYANSYIRQMLCNPVIGNLVAALSGASTVKLWGSQLYYKPPHQSAVDQIGYHRDAQHLPEIQSGGFTVWIPLTDATPESGTLRYLIGSHQITEPTQLIGAQDPNVESQLQRLKTQWGENKCQEYPVYLTAGGLSIHHQDTIHASLCNESSSPRVAIAASIVTDKTCYHRSSQSSGNCYSIRDIINDNSRSHEYTLNQ